MIYLSAPLKFALGENPSLNHSWFWLFGVDSGVGGVGGGGQTGV